MEKLHQPTSMEANDPIRNGAGRWDGRNACKALAKPKPGAAQAVADGLFGRQVLAGK